MAVPNDRRVIYGTHVIPQETYSTTSTEVVREEGSSAGRASYTDYRLDTTVGKNFGGKGIVQITEDQGIDGWVSFEHDKHAWELDSSGFWEDDDTCWDGTLSIANGSATKLIDSGTVLFLYIKNVGSNEAKLALEGNEYDILIPPDASISIRVDSISAANIKVDTTSGTTEIEYIIAT